MRNHERFSRRDFLKAGLGAASGVGAASTILAAASEKPSGTPNILFIITDDQSWDSIGYASGGKVRTPNLDRLARGGVIFNSAYCNSMPCIPSRACIMTGLHHHRWERGPKLGLIQGLREGTWTWAHALRQAGYRTGLIGKMHFQPMRAHHGFETTLFAENKLNWEWRAKNDHYDDYTLWLARQGLVELPKEQPAGVVPKLIKPTIPKGAKWSWPLDPKYHPISWVRDRAIDFLKKDDKRPYCLLVSFKHPHAPYLPAKPFDTWYDPESITVPDDNWDDMEGMPQSVKDLAKKKKKWYFSRTALGPKWFRRMAASYWGLVSQIDDAVGTIVQRVNADDTLCLFTTDHGDYMGKRDRVFKMPLVPFDAVARVPFCAWGYGTPKGAAANPPVSLADLAPTFLRCAGLEIPPDLDGAALQDYFNDPNHEADRPVYCYGPDGFDMVRRRGMKYFRSHDGKVEMLFDLSTDPGELKNLAADPKWAQERAKLSKEMDRVMNKPAPTLPHFG